MAAPLATAFVAIRPDLRRFKQETDAGINKGLSGTAEKSGHGWGTRFVKSAGAAVAAVGLISLGKTVLDAAQESINTQKQVQATIRSTGHVANVSAKQISALASAIEVKTGIDDDAVKSGQAMLLTFTNVRNEAGKGNKIFDQATKTLTDMTAAMNGGNVTSENLRKQAIQLGKALNDPVKGMTALSRVGVTFTAGQKQQVEAMVKSGHTLDAQKLILHELNKEFGGSAEASATTTKKLSAMVGELEESVGQAILPFVNAIASKLLPVVVQFGNWIQNVGVPYLSRLAKDVVPALVGVFHTLGVGISTLVTFFKGLPGPVQTAIKIFAALVVGGIALRGIMIALEGVSPFGWVAIAVTATIAAVGLIRQHWQAILDFFKGMGHWFNQYVLAPIENVFDWIKKNWPLLLAIITGPFGLATLWVVKHFGQVREFIGNVMKDVAVFVLRAVDLMLGAFRGFSGFMGHLPGPLGAPFRAMSDSIDTARDHLGKLITDLTNKLPTNRKVTLKVVGEGIWRVVQDITNQLSTGGLVTGPGGPTDDAAGVFALSNNEWVIRASSAMQYGDKAMKAVNEGTATIWHPGMAQGGRVSGNMFGTPQAIGNFTVSEYNQTNAAIEDSVVKATRKGLAHGWGNGAGGKLVNFLRQFVGHVPYVWGGTTPAGWDCSGMVQYGLAHALGIAAPRTSEQQFAWVRHTPDQKGALVFFVGAGGPPPGHVGISLGNGQMINAAGTQLGTIVSGTGGNMGYGVPPGFAKGGKVKDDPQRKAWLAQLARDVSVLHSDEKAAVHRRKILRHALEISELWFLTHPHVKKGGVAYNEQQKALENARRRLRNFNKRENEKENTLRKKIALLRDLTGYPKARKYGGPGTPSPVDDGGGDTGGVDDGGGDTGGSSGGDSGTQITFPVTTPAMPWQGPYTDAIGDAASTPTASAPAFPGMSIAAPVSALSTGRLNRSYGPPGSTGGGWGGQRTDAFLARMVQLLESAPHVTGQVMGGVLNGQAGIGARQAYYTTR